ncbi:MAG: hypothetical protein LBL86_09215 [Coriobacteriales bacterium]|jgi:hypothetical protein|nr:hypothetical protein [Coriobacteriales bacterium]
MRHKRGIPCLLAALLAALLLQGPSASYGMEYDAGLPTDLNQEEITEQSVYEVNLWGSEIERPATAADIDLAKSFKFYNTTDIFSLQESGFEEVQQALEAGGYILEVPVYIGNDTVCVNVSKGEPLDYSKIGEELLANTEWLSLQESRVGQWYAEGSYLFEDRHLDYYAVAAERTGIYDRIPLLVGGLPYFHSPVAIYPDDEGNLGTMTVIHPATAPWEALGIERPSEDAEFVFDYGYVKEKVDSLPPEKTADEPAATTPGGQTGQEPATTGAESPSSSPPGGPSSPSGTDAAVGPASADTPGASAPPPPGGAAQDPAPPPQDAPAPPPALLPAAIALAAVAALAAALALCARRRKAKAPSSAQGDGRPGAN